MSTVHFIQTCLRCSAIIAQCRCPGPKTRTYGVCDACNAADKAISTAGIIQATALKNPCGLTDAWAASEADAPQPPALRPVGLTFTAADMIKSAGYAVITEEDLADLYAELARLKAMPENAAGHAGRRPRVYVAGPISLGDVALNVRKAIEVGDWLATRGAAPFIPHLSHFWGMFHPHEHEFWMEQDFAWLMLCDALVRIPGASPGADREVSAARELGLRIFDWQDTGYGITDWAAWHQEVWR